MRNFTGPTARPQRAIASAVGHCSLHKKTHLLRCRAVDADVLHHGLFSVEK